MTADIWTMEAAGAGAPGKSDSLLPEVRSGAVLLGLLFAGLLGWAAFIPLDAGAMAEGTVVVSGNRQAVQHRDGGVVTQLNVTEGKLVKQGDILLQISASELVAAERGMAGEVLVLLAQRERLRAERAGERVLLAPAEFANLPEGDRVLAEEAFSGQRMLFEARRNSLATQRSVLSQKVKQHSEQIIGVEHQILSNQTQSALLSDELDGLRTLVPDGYVALNRIRAMEREAAQLEGGQGSFRADVARLNEAIGEARLEMTAVDKRQAEEIATELRDVQLRLDELLPKLHATREQLGRSTVRAPASGKIVGLKVFTIGGVVAAGDTLMEVVPQDRALVVEARVAPTDADDLTVGMETQIRFSALQEKSLPILHGEITKVSADSFEDDRTGQRYFLIEVMAPPEALAQLREVRADGGLRAGLPAEVMVPLRKRTALDYLLEPLSQSLWRAGREH